VRFVAGRFSAARREGDRRATGVCRSASTHDSIPEEVTLYNFGVQGIAVLDAGGQYCHLLARRVREAGVQSHVLPIDVTAEELGAISGIIISGGPRSVTEPNSPRIDPSILSIGVPVLGICYGHQLLAATLPGGAVKPSHASEYG